MRRYGACLLALLLLAQTSGTAVASPVGDMKMWHFEIGSLLEPLFTTIEDSQIVAQLSGTENRYAAMHAPPPRIASAEGHVNTAKLITSLHPLKPQIRIGIPDHVVMPPRSAIDPHHPRLDPLAMRPSRLAPALTQPSPAGLIEPLRSIVVSAKNATSRPAQQRRAGPKPLAISAGGTGIEHWWSYEERAIPGIGKAMVNVGTGNLLVAAVDVDIPERGIDLAFQRVYNSQSLHDYNGDDGGDSAIFGNLWTNNFDANMVYNSTANTITVYDIDGTACTYTSNADGTWKPCTGEYATLGPTDNTDCTYAWTKKNGTVYWFHADDNGNGSCGIAQAKKGHLQEILGRNNNNSITFTYWYDGNGKSAENVTEIDAAHSDNQELIMKFGHVGTNGPNELATITLPNAQHSQLQYLYDTSGNLLEVERPGNDAAQTLPETYAYASGSSALQEACGPRCTLSTPQNGGSPTDGSALLFTLDGSQRLTKWQAYGVINIDPGDGYGIIQPWDHQHQGWENAYTANFVYGVGTACSNTSSGTTSMCDSDEHSTIWTTDSSSRVTQTQEWTGTAEGLMLVTAETWDTSNNLTSTTDARGYTTHYAYDGNGNTIAVARPSPASGQDRPTSLYLYDSNNNLQFYCDPVYSAANGLDWNSGGYNGSGCPGGVGTTRYKWHSPTDGSEPFGQLTDIWTACFNASCVDHFNGIPEPGYHTSFTYYSNGLPDVVTGDTISQPSTTISTRQPKQIFGYDTYGDLTSYNNGGGTWQMTYDDLNRLSTRVDPDTGSPTSYFYYNSDGTMSLTETPFQHHLGAGHAFKHDADGNVVSQTVHRNGLTGQIVKAYDGLDRLVEVQEPQDSTNDAFKNPWITRYIYDLTEGGTVSFNGSPYYPAYGNLYATQELLPNNSGKQTYSGPAQSVNNTTFEPLKGTQYDALDRAVGGYSIISNTNSNTNELSTTSFDAAGYYGLRSQQCQPPVGSNQLCKTFDYDNDSRVVHVGYSDGMNRYFTYDAAGHNLTSSKTHDDQTQFWYDLEGRVVNSEDPNIGTSQAKYTHEFYPDGKLKQLDVESSALTTKNGLFVYSYTNQGLSGETTVTYTPQSVNTTIDYSYTPAGRLSGRAESGSGSNSSQTAMTYDVYGQLSAATYPDQPKIPDYNYNAEGELLSFGINGTPNQTFSYTMRGEALPPSSNGNPSFGNPGSFFLGNGVQVQSASGTGVLNFQSTWDDRMGVMSAFSTNAGTYPQNSSSFAYDAAGRQIGSGSSYSSDASSIPTTGMTARSYDIDNHTLDTTQSWMSTPQQQTLTAANVSVYDWGPSDHPIRIGSADSATATPPPDSAAKFDTLHWDGDQLIFETNNQGQVDDIKMGSSADITPLDSVFQGITFWDRGPGGAVVYCHNSTGSGGTGQVATFPMLTSWGGSPCFIANQTQKFPNSIEWFNGPLGIGASNGAPRSGGVGQGKVVGMYRTDGISDGANTIQGVRTTDATSGTWTTPDAFAGITDDPKTQKSYIWNGNNPINYSDPSGYAINGSAFNGGLDDGTWISCSNCNLLPTDDGGTSGSFSSSQVAYTSHIGQGQLAPGLLTQIAMQSVGQAMSFAHSPMGDSQPFMVQLASIMNGYLASYAPGFTVSVNGNSVSGHNSVGNSIVIQGDKSYVTISENIQSTPNANVHMWWDSGFTWFSISGAGAMVWQGNGIHKPLERQLPPDAPRIPDQLPPQQGPPGMPPT